MARTVVRQLTWIAIFFSARPRRPLLLSRLDLMFSEDVAGWSRMEARYGKDGPGNWYE